TPTHTVRNGILVSAERRSVQTPSSVLPASGGVHTLPDSPFKIFDSTGITGYTYSLYGQDAWRILPTVTINGGLRFDDYDAFRNEWELSPRLNVVWMATPTTTVHAGYARYFTPPPLVFVSSSSLNRLTASTAEPEVKQNTTINAERAHYVDAGVHQPTIRGPELGSRGD